MKTGLRHRQRTGDVQGKISVRPRRIRGKVMSLRNALELGRLQLELSCVLKEGWIGARVRRWVKLVIFKWCTIHERDRRDVGISV